jgi:hypothetical protein
MLPKISCVSYSWWMVVLGSYLSHSAKVDILFLVVKITLSSCFMCAFHCHIYLWCTIIILFGVNWVIQNTVWCQLSDSDLVTLQFDSLLPYHYCPKLSVVKLKLQDDLWFELVFIWSKFKLWCFQHAGWSCWNWASRQTVRLLQWSYKP